VIAERHRKDGLELIAFGSPADWEQWLEREQSVSPGIWMKIAKRDSGIATVDYQQALEVAICFGWIDGQRGRYDETHFLTRFTPRGPRSRWSQRNCALAEVLLAKGAMRERGRAEVDRAKGDGRWEAAYPSQANATVPDDMQAALDANPTALAFFLTLDSINRYAFLYRLHHLRRPDARAARIERYVEMLARGERLHD
jgi:uncharacterized protein YdeI (YjbR/CyaY-like superfamily)